MPGWEERRGAGGFKERSRQGEGETGSKAHQTVRLFTHEPQARYSRVSVECQHGLPVQIQLQLLGSRRREKQPYKMTSHATFPVIATLLKHTAQSHFHIAHSLDICHPPATQTCRQNVCVAVPGQVAVAQLFFYQSPFKISSRNLHKRGFGMRSETKSSAVWFHIHTLLPTTSSFENCASPCRPDCRPSVTKCPGLQTWSDPSFPALVFPPLNYGKARVPAL